MFCHSDGNFKVHIQKNKTGVFLGFILAPHMHSLYITDYPQHLELTMFCSKWQSSICHGKAKTFVFSNLQGRHTHMEPWCECRNI